MRRALCLAIVLLALMATSAVAAGPLLTMMREHMKNRAPHDTGTLTTTLAGLNVAYWLPDTDKPMPLVIFSHGLGGCKTQSRFLMKALAEAGYVVVAPDHKDNLCGGGEGGENSLGNPEEKFGDPKAWTPATYEDRKRDIMNLYAALKADKNLSPRIDWNNVALSGHSLGGYTVMGLAGGWPSWKMPGIKAVLALSPYVAPFMVSGDLAHLGIPVMYQGGTRDYGITPSVKKPGGAYDNTSSPAYFVEFKKTGHLGFTDMLKGAQQGIIDYSIWFLDHTLKGGTAPLEKEDGVSDLRVK